MEIHFICLLLTTMVIMVRGQCPNDQQCKCESNSPDLPILYCARSGLTSVPQFTYTTIAFSEVTLAGNPITTLPANAFKTINGQGLNTKILDLSDTSITSIDVSAFSGLEATLEVLKLHVNAMNSFPTIAIRGLTKLRQIEFKGFNFAQLPQDALGGLTNLEIVSFDTCQLTAINAGDFTSQVNTLQELYLVSNQFTGVPSQGLGTLNQLRKLDLSQNQINTIPRDAFSPMNALQELVISQNGVNTISLGAFNGVEDTLKLLSLSNNNEGIVEADLSPISALYNLESLELSYNSIESLPSQFFQTMSKLKTFKADSNKLRSLSSKSFQGLGGSLQTLSLHDNLITSIGVDTFAVLNSLKDLNLDNQNLSAALNRNTFSGLENSLESLSLTSTQFSSLHWSAVGRLVRLKSLKLNRNLIWTVPDNTFINLGNLQSLNLENNQISQVRQSSFKGLQFSLEKVFLSSNKIMTVDECVFYKTSVKEVQLDSNPLHCDCQLQWLSDFINNNMNPSIIFWECQTPAQHAGKMFRDVPTNELTCTTTLTNLVCEDYTITTTTTTPTAKSTPTGGTYPLYLNISHTTEQSMQASWEVTDVTGVDSWRVKATDIVSGEVVYDQVFGVDVRGCLINNLAADTKYSICLTPILTGGSAPSATTGPIYRQSCSSEKTMPKAGGISSPQNRLPIILGVVLAVVVVIMIIVAVLCFVRWRNTKDPPVFKEADGVSNDGSFVPQVGTMSKRFSKPKAHMLINMNGCTPQEMEQRLEGFTPQERERILQLFSTSGASTVSMLSTQSMRYGQEPNGVVRAGYYNPLQASQSHGRLYSGDYDEIPADTYDEIPADRQEQEGAYNIPYEDDGSRPKSTGDILGSGASYI